MKRFLTLAMACAAVLPAIAFSYNLRGTEFLVDTISHQVIGPGTTVTTLRMTAGTRGMDVYYSRIDLTNPHVDMRAVAGQDRYAGCELTSSMAQRKSAPGARYMVGINGDFFMTSGTSSRGESLIGVPCGSIIGDDVVYHARTNEWYTQFVFDTEGRPHVGTTNFSGTITDTRGNTAHVGGVNADSQGNEVVIYNDRYLAGTNQFGNCCEVTAVLAEGETWAIGRPVRMVVTGTPSTAGDMTIPAGGYVVHGYGEPAAFVAQLQPGDELTLTINVSVDGTPLVPRQMISGFPKSVLNGEVTDTEWMLDEFSTRQPVTEIGIADDGNTIVMIVIDGRSARSSGCRVSEVADLMRQLGCTQVLNFDSGGSTTFYTTAFGICNRPSDGTERADANGVFAVYTAPDDSTLSSIAFVDWQATLPRYAQYTPRFYGYNRYGLLVDLDVQGVKLECDPSLGVIEGNSLVATGASGTLTARCGDFTATVEVIVEGSSETIAALCDSIIVDGLHTATVPVVNTVGSTSACVAPSCLTWSSSDESVVTVDSETGVLHAVADGRATVTGVIDDVTVASEVIVERPTAARMSVASWSDATAWRTSQSGGKQGTLTAEADGTLLYTYVGASSRAPKLTLTRDLRLWSLPDSIVLTVDPHNAPINGITLALRPAGGKLTYVNLKPEAVVPDVPFTVVLPLDSVLDVSDVRMFPVTVGNIQFTMGASETGASYSLQLMDIATAYAAMGTPHVTGDANGDGEVNGSDINLLINIILGRAESTSAADVDGNGTVDGSDINRIINIILGKQ